MKEVVAEGGTIRMKPSLLHLFGDRHQLLANNTYPHFPLDQPNFIEFMRHFHLSAGKLKQNRYVEKFVAITYPNPRYAPGTPQHISFCRCAYIRFAPWTSNDIEMILDDDQIVDA